VETKSSLAIFYHFTLTARFGLQVMSQNHSSDVTCRSIMATSYPVLNAGMTLAECVRTLLQHRVLAMPAVDESGRYLGQFRKNVLVSALLPQVAVTDQRFERIARMIETGLLRDTMGDVRERFVAIANEPVSRYLDRDAPILRPDQPLVIAMFYFYQGRNFLPVVEQETGMLVGVVSAWDVLESILQS
jgi:CBS-domain-containing membrane protein